MFKISVSVVGFGKLEKELEALKTKGFRIAKKAAREGAEVIVEQVRDLTPVDTDHLRPSMGVKMEVDAGDNTVTAVIAPRPGFDWEGASTGWAGHGKHHEPRIYGEYQEEGFWHVLAHRQIAGLHFMRRGAEAGRLGALSRIRAVCREELEKENG